AAVFNSSSCRLQMATSAPAAANARAIAAPRPLLPPVTSAVRPERSKSLFCIIHPRVAIPVYRTGAEFHTATSAHKGLAASDAIFDANSVTLSLTGVRARAVPQL